MANDQQTLLKRRAALPGTVSPMPVPNVPELPPDVLTRFPSLRRWQEDMAVWVERLNNSLSRHVADL